MQIVSAEPKIWRFPITKGWKTRHFSMSRGSLRIYKLSVILYDQTVTPKSTVSSRLTLVSSRVTIEHDVSVLGKHMTFFGDPCCSTSIFSALNSNLRVTFQHSTNTPGPTTSLSSPSPSLRFPWISPSVFPHYIHIVVPWYFHYVPLHFHHNHTPTIVHYWPHLFSLYFKVHHIGI